LLDVYGVVLGKRQVYRAMSSMIIANRFLQSRFGRRKRLIGSVEGLFQKSGALSSMIHDQESDGYDYLNLSRDPWVFPWENPDEEASLRHQTFTDMFERAAEDSVRFIKCLESVLSGATDPDSFLETIGSNSFSTGKDCKTELEFLYHANLQHSALQNN